VGLAPVHSRWSGACVSAGAHLRALLDPLFTEKSPTGAAGIRSDVSGVRLSTALCSPITFAPIAARKNSYAMEYLYNS
jgi:hypothetical protein